MIRIAIAEDNQDELNTLRSFYPGTDGNMILRCRLTFSRTEMK